MTKKTVREYGPENEGVVWMMQPMRLKMLDAISEGTITHGDIAKRTGSSLSAVSKFLVRAKGYDFVVVEAGLTKEGRACKKYTLTKKGEQIHKCLTTARELMHDGHDGKKQKHMQS
jgi:DNA-binding MarR family transcriptional regulator